MKRILTAAAIPALLLLLGIPVAAAADSTLSLSESFAAMKPALILLFAILTILVLSCIFFTISYKNRKARRRKRKSNGGAILAMLYITTVLVLCCTVFCCSRYRQTEQALSMSSQETPAPSGSVTDPDPTDAPSDPTWDPMEETEAPTDAPTEPPATEPDPTFTAKFTELSDPDNWGIDWDILVNNSVVDSYLSDDPIDFDTAADFFPLEGVSSFRGNNFRNDPSYGTATVTQEKIERIWGRDIGSLNGWPGSGWTGQPLVVRWDAETRAIMNLYENKKEKDGLVEVVLATLDGYVYFYDLDDGSYTRDPINLGMNFKGSGCLDPRGYPIFYVGSGITINGKSPRMYAISLVDGSILYEQNGYDTTALRAWTAFDACPIIHGETDTLIWPGENGLINVIKLNTQFDKQAGTLSMAPEIVAKTRYSTTRSRSGNYWIGYECSAAAVDNYLFTSENGGMFFCVDLNTLELVWAQDTKDDSNSTPIFHWGDDGNGYLYTAPSLHWTARSSEGTISIYKLNAATGEIVWEVPFHCHTIPDLSGGVQSSPLLGRDGTELEDVIIYPIARTEGFYDGTLVALDTETGEILWERYMDAYTWSSPAAVYTDDGRAYIVMCDSAGNVMLLDSQNGETLSYVNLGSNIEASPVVFEDMVIIGTRGQIVCGLKVS